MMPTGRCVYLAAPMTLGLRARSLARQIRELRIEVVSTWHGAADAPAIIEFAATGEEALDRANRARAELFSASDLVLLYGRVPVACGALWAAGYAGGLGYPVHAVAAEAAALLPPMLASEDVTQHPSEAAFLAWLGRHAATND